MCRLLLEVKVTESTVFISNLMEQLNGTESLKVYITAILLHLVLLWTICFITYLFREIFYELVNNSERNHIFITK